MLNAIHIMPTNSRVPKGTKAVWPTETLAASCYDTQMFRDPQCQRMRGKAWYGAVKQLQATLEVLLAQDEATSDVNGKLPGICLFKYRQPCTGHRRTPL